MGEEAEVDVVSDEGCEGRETAAQGVQNFEERV